MTNHAQAQIITDRQEKLNTLLGNSKLSAMVFNPGPSLTYLTGLHFHLMERPVVVLVRPESPISIILPELETAKLDRLPYSIEVYPYGENPDTWGEVFAQALMNAGLGDGRIGVEPRRLRVLELDYLKTAAPAASFEEASGVVKAMRVRKDPSEIQAMQKAVHIAQNALQEALTHIKIGISEREMAAELCCVVGQNPSFHFSQSLGLGQTVRTPTAALQNAPCLQETWRYLIGVQLWTDMCPTSPGYLWPENRIWNSPGSGS
jgi:Xaa-Pro dipeptidase